MINARLLVLPLVILAVMVLGFTCAGTAFGEPEGKLNTPTWIQDKVTNQEGIPNVGRVKQYKLDDQVYYLFEPFACKDCLYSLYDVTGKYLCAPWGSWSGHGDQKCPEMREKLKNPVVIWTYSPESATTTSQPSTAPHQSGWKKIAVAERVIYYADTGSIACSVEVEPDGDILVHAVDADWHGKIVTHDARVRSGYIDNLTTVLKATGEKDQLDGYLVFTTKCADLAQKLPLEVKAKFNGAFSVK